eukprot:Nk52_evm44s352 gene=Nk52_evmTU44s352
MAIDEQPQPQSNKNDTLKLELLGRIAVQHGLRGDSNVEKSFAGLVSLMGTPGFQEKYMKLKEYIMGNRRNTGKTDTGGLTAFFTAQSANGCLALKRNREEKSITTSVPKEKKLPPTISNHPPKPARRDESDDLKSLGWLQNVSLQFKSIDPECTKAPKSKGVHRSASMPTSKAQNTTPTIKIEKQTLTKEKVEKCPKPKLHSSKSSGPSSIISSISDNTNDIDDKEEDCDIDITLPPLEPIPKEQLSPDRKPSYSFACLIAMAINSRKEKRMTVSDIYDWVQATFPFYRHCSNGWKNSIRHNLSLNKCFRKTTREKAEPGKGSFWYVVANYRHMLYQAINKHSTRGLKSGSSKKKVRRHTTDGVNIKSLASLAKPTSEDLLDPGCFVGSQKLLQFPKLDFFELGSTDQVPSTPSSINELQSDLNFDLPPGMEEFFDSPLDNSLDTQLLGDIENQSLLQGCLMGGNPLDIDIDDAEDDNGSLLQQSFDSSIGNTLAHCQLEDQFVGWDNDMNLNFS